MKRPVLIAMLWITGLLFSGCGTPHSGSVFNDPSTVNSPDGTVHYGASAYSPDGTRYAREIFPTWHGDIGVFQRSNDQLLMRFRTLPPGGRNDLKGMCWSRDSRHLAIMYHTDVTHGHVRLFDASDGEYLGYLGPGNAYHFIVYSKDNRWIYLSFDGRSVQARYDTIPIPESELYSPTD